jgi:outer membrane protein assembly complex protein YaeT
VPVRFIAFLLFASSLFAQPRISKITFTGNEYFDDNQLASWLALKPGSIFVKEQLDLDIKNIIRNYQSNGFLNCRIEKLTEDYNFDSSGVSLEIEVTEGKQVLIGEILFQGNKVFTDRELSNIMFTRSGRVLNNFTLNQDIEQILTKYEAKGFAFAQVSVKEIENYADGATEKLRIILRIDENERLRVDNVSIEGNETTKDYVIFREMRLPRNKIITRESITEIKLRLENLGYFESVEQPKIYKYANRTVLKLKVKEGNTNTFDGVLGYVPPSGSEQDGYFTGFINLSLRNLFGTGRRIDARWQKEIRTTQELELKYIEPWVLGFPLNISAGFLQRIQDSTYVKRTVSGRAEAMISAKFSGAVSGYVERVIPTLEQNTAGYLYTVFDSRLISVGAEIKFDTRDYVYNPSFGILYKTGYTVGQKKIYNAASFPGLDITQNFTVQRFLIDLDLYYSFFKRQSSLVSLHAGEVKSPRLEDGDYFRFGGIHSVRGYQENQILASRLGWANLELRYMLTRRTFASLFYDIGYYWRAADEVTQRSQEQALVYGYGLGVRVETKLGIFGVSYALGRGNTILEGKVHFGLVNDF